ncbi:MAG: hypothetical protein GYA24_22950 [Candidatus Lokiarchaeota archaeon]|nr:hypothetical protein [Candidatus Lokiarchaeota archaeon]
MATKRELGKDTNRSSIVELLIRGAKAITMDEYHKWRMLRNDIVHKNEKVDDATAAKAKDFFAILVKGFDTLISKIQESPESSAKLGVIIVQMEKAQVTRNYESTSGYDDD